MKKEKGQKVKFIVYVVVRVLVVLALIRQIWEHDWHDVMLWRHDADPAVSADALVKTAGSAAA